MFGGTINFFLIAMFLLSKAQLEIPFETLLSDKKNPNLFLNNSKDFLVLNTRICLTGDLDLINVGQDLMRFELRGGNLKIAENSRLFLKNFHFILTSNNSQYVFSALGKSSFRIEDSIVCQSNQSRILVNFLTSLNSLSIQFIRTYFQDFRLSTNQDTPFIQIKNTKSFVVNETRFINNSFSGLNFLNLQSTYTEICKTCFYWNYLQENSFFIFSDSSLFMENLEIANNVFTKSSFYVAEESLNPNNFTLIFNSWHCSNNTAYYLINIKGKGLVSNFLANNLTILNNLFQKSCLRLQRFANVSLSNLLFENNLSKNLILCLGSDSFSLESFSCIGNNYDENCDYCGSCALIANTLFSNLLNIEVIKCASSLSPSGIIFDNSIGLNGKVLISQSVFSDNFRKNTNNFSFAHHLGLNLMVSNDFDVSIIDCLFRNNTLYLPFELYGGPILTFISKEGSVTFTRCIFQMNRSFQGSLSFEFEGREMNLNQSFFSQISQIDLNSNTSALIVIGHLTKLNVNSCFVEKSVSYFGLFLISERNVASVLLLDHLNLNQNIGYFTSGISLGHETFNKRITWQNSLIYDHKNIKSDGMLLYASIPQQFVSLNSTFINMTIINNFCSDDQNREGAVIIFWVYCKSASLIIENSSIINNNFNSMFSVYGLIESLRFSVTNCAFMDNLILAELVMGGVANLDFSENLFMNIQGSLFNMIDSMVWISNLTISNVFKELDFLFIFSQKSNISIQNLSLKSSLGNEIFNFLNIDSFFLRNAFVENISSPDSCLFSFYRSRFVLEDLFFANSKVHSFAQIKSSSGMISQTTLSNTQMNFTFLMTKISSLFLDNFFPDPHNFFLSLIDSEVDFSDSFLNMSEHLLCRPHMVLINSNISLINVNISQEYDWEYFVTLTKGIFFAENLKANIFSLFLMMNKASISIKRSIFQQTCLDYLRDQEIDFSPFFLKTSVIFNINESNFLNFWGRNSLINLRETHSANVFSISNCNFINNSAIDSNGGAIFTENLRLTLENNSFISNLAENGGAIYFSCTLQNIGICDFKLIGNAFENNKANNSGGAFYWQYCKPQEISNNYLSNYAGHYGNDYASFCLDLNFQIVRKEQDKIVFLENTIENEITTSNLSEDLFVKLIPNDYYGQAIKYFPKELIMTANLFLKQENLSSSTNFFSPFCNNFLIYGKIVQSYNTVSQAYIFDDVTMRACPSFKLVLTFSINLPLEDYGKLDFSEKYNLNHSYTSKNLSIAIPDCQRGEIFEYNLLKCMKCPSNYFSLSTTDIYCSICPKNAFCPGGDLIDVDPNYWRSSINSSELYECESGLSVCIGGIDSTCSPNYEGILCSSCNSQSKQNIFGKCIGCVFAPLYLLGYIFFLLLMHIVFSGSLAIFETKMTNVRKRLTIYLLHYFHFLYLSQYFEDSFSGNIEINLLLNSFSWFSLDCFFVYIKDMSFYSLLLMKMFLYLNIGLFNIILGFFSNKGKYKSLMSFFLFYRTSSPLLLKALTDNLVCVKIEGVNYLKNDTKIRCDDLSYLIVKHFLIVPVILLLVLISPLIYVFIEAEISKKSRCERYIFACLAFFRDLVRPGQVLTEKQKELKAESVFFIEKLFLIAFNVWSLSEQNKQIVFFVIFVYFNAWLVQKLNFFPQRMKRIFIFINFILMFDTYNSFLRRNFRHTITNVGLLLISILIRIAFYFFCLLIYFKDIKPAKKLEKVRIFNLLFRDSEKECLNLDFTQKKYLLSANPSKLRLREF